MPDNFKINITIPKKSDDAAPKKVDEGRSILLRFNSISLTIKIATPIIAVVAIVILLQCRSKSEQTEIATVDTQLDNVTSRIMGYVKLVPVSEGNHVNVGEILAELDTTDFMVESKIKAVKLQKAEHDLRRATKLASESGISKSDLELAQLNYAAAEADSEATQLKLKYSLVRSPIQGTVARRSIQLGQFIQPGQTLFVIVPDHKLWVTALFKESQIIRIHPGQPAKITVDAIHRPSFEGRVQQIMPTSLSKMSLLPADNSTGHFSRVVQRFSVLIDFDTYPPDVRAGMSASVEVKLDTR